MREKEALCGPRSVTVCARGAVCVTFYKMK